MTLFGLDTRIVQGRGSYLQGEDGREYLDFLSQYGALPFGHNPPELWEAMTAFRDSSLPILMQPFHPPEAERLAGKLAELAPGDLSISVFANSGAETVEAAIKLARARTGRKRILSTTNGFHGKTLGALSATGKPLYQQDFFAPSEGFDYIPFGDLAALETALRDGAGEIAAFLVEPIQGEGGVILPPEGYLEGAIALCRAHDVLSVVDEIQTGLGRTGELFCCSTLPEPPDMLLLSKALGGGMMPIGACIVRPSAWDDRFGLLHSSTFANGNLAAHVACRALDLLTAEEGRLVAQVRENGEYLRTRLREVQGRYPGVIREVRGRGYMNAVEFHPLHDGGESAILAYASLNGGTTAFVSSYLMNVCGLVTAPMFNDTRTLRLQPALTAGRAELDRAVDALAEVCEVLARRDGYALVRHILDAPPAPLAERAAALTQPAGAIEATGDPTKFAFLVHFTQMEDIYRCEPSLRQADETHMDAFRGWAKQVGPGYAFPVPNVASPRGARAEGCLISLPLLPEDMMGRERKRAVAMIGQAIDMARRDGISRIGLGAFTSIVTRGGAAVTDRDASITSGNTLTSVITVQGLAQVVTKAGLDLADLNVAVVGASGAIGRLVSLMLASQVRGLTLVGNPSNPHAPTFLRRVADEICGIGFDGHPHFVPYRQSVVTRIHALCEQMQLDCDKTGGAERVRDAFAALEDDAPLDWTTDLDRALSRSDVVVVATSGTDSLVDPLALAPGTIVCDIARPPNVVQRDLSDCGVIAFDGGLVKPPFDLNLGPSQVLPDGICWGCLGETMLLALAGEEGDYSIGSALSLAEAARIAELARQHDFAPATPQWYGTELPDALFEAFRERRALRHAARQARS